MANPASMDVTPGAGAHVATFTIVEGAEDRHLQRQVNSTAEGEDVSVGSFIQIDTTITRPADTNPYTALDAWANSTTAPTAGGFTFNSASRGPGLSGLITDLIALGSAAQSTQLQAVLFLFDSQVTALNDNAGFSMSITDARKMVAAIAFTLEPIGGGVSYAKVPGVNEGFTTVGGSGLYGLVRVTNGYTPVSSEALTFRLKITRTS